MKMDRQHTDNVKASAGKADAFYALVRDRQSDRAFDTRRTVDRETLDRILKAARLAPSACNGQPWKMVVVDDPGLALNVGKAVSGMGMNKFAATAPVHILVVEESGSWVSRLGGKIKDKYFPLMDIGILASYITLAAESEGLGSCMLGWFDEETVKRLVGIPRRKRLLLDVVVGYPLKQVKRPKKRKAKSEIVSYNRY